MTDSDDQDQGREPFSRAREQYEINLPIFEKWLGEQPKTTKCPHHHEREMTLDAMASKNKSGIDFGESHFKACYRPCPSCEEELLWPKYQDMGVPSEMLDAKFDSLAYTRAEDVATLEATRRYAMKPVGFLVLCGDTGCGKTSLAVCALKQYQEGRFVRHVEFMSRIRQGYHSSQSSEHRDFLEVCQRTSLLVLDDFTMDQNGSDVFTKSEELLCYRHAEFKPTIITTNYPGPQFLDKVGRRVADRVRDAVTGAGGVFELLESSHRACSDYARHYEQIRAALQRVNHSR